MFRVVVIACLLMLAACSQKTVEPTEKDQAIIDFQKGEAAFESGLYQDAIASLEKVRESYYSPELTTLVELKIAEAYFLGKHDVEASVAFEEFLKNHPRHPREADILYQLGIAYTRQMRSHDQDQAPTRQALSTFRRFKTNYPDDPRNTEVDGHIAAGINQLADSEMAVARFYYKTRHYGAAIVRIEGLLKTYPSYPGRDAAYLLLGQAHLKNGNREQATTAFNTLFNQFSDSEHIETAQEFLDKNF